MVVGCYSSLSYTIQNVIHHRKVSNLVLWKVHVDHMGGSAVCLF